MAKVTVGNSIGGTSLPPENPRPGSHLTRDYHAHGMVVEHSAGRLPAGDLDALASSSGIRRVHVLAWRDFDDPEAGGSEIHAHQVVRRWAAAGLEVTVRTSGAPGLAEQGSRDNYRVVRRGGRYTVFPRAVVAELAGRHIITGS